jgi:hypothetical protein
MKLAQDLVAKKCGIFKENESLDDMTLKHFLEMYKEPLSKGSMEAIIKLTEVTHEEKIKKQVKKEKKKKKASEEVASKKKGSKEKKGKLAPVGASF